MIFEQRRFRTSGGEMAYVDLGEGPAVLLLHGFPTSSLLWRREIPLLAARMRVLAPDLLGYGGSDRPRGRDLSEQAQVCYVRELLRHLGIDRLAVVGHDVGGALAQLLALDPPPEVTAMVLIDSACFETWPVEWVRRLQMLDPGAMTPQMARDVVTGTFDGGMARRPSLPEGDLAAYVEPWVRDPEALCRAAGGILGRGLAGRDEDLSALEAEAMIVWGEEDPYLPCELAERLGEAMPGSTVALLPGCSHFVGEDAPGTVGQLLEGFLRARYLGLDHGHGAAHAHGPAAAGPVPVQVFTERPPGGFRWAPDDEPEGP